MTKQVLLLTLTLAELVLAANCYANYSIELKNGTVFVTDKYRIEKNGLIKFSYLNGTISISEKRVKAITGADAPLVKGAAGAKTTNAAKEKAARIKTALRNNQYNMLICREKFRLAKKHHRETAKDNAWKRLTRLKTERDELREATLGAYHGTLPDWWHDILNEKQFHVIKENINTSGY